MRFSNHQLLVCRTSFEGRFVSGRFAYQHANGPSTPPSREQIIEQEVREGVNVERTQIEGFYLTNPPDRVIEMGRLGVRTEIAAALRRQNRPGGGGTMTDADIQEGIINTRITAQLRGIAAQRVAVEHQQRGWFGKKLGSAGETVNDVSNPFRSVGRFFRSVFGRGGANNLRYNTAEERHREQRMNELFGNNRDIPSIVGYVVGQFTPAQMAAAAPLLGPAVATPAALTAATVAQLEANLANVRRVPDRDFIQNYELLLNVRRIEARERSKILSIDLYDPTRLRRFLESMRTGSANNYRTLTEQILEKSALDKLDSDPATQALVAHLMYLYESGPTPPNWTLIQTELNTIRDALPVVKTDSKKSDEEKTDSVKNAEKIDELYNKFTTQKHKLDKAYAKTQGVNQNIVDARASLATQQTAAQNLGPIPTTGNDPNAAARATIAQSITHYLQEISKLEQSRSPIHADVVSEETDFKDLAGQLVTTLVASTSTATPPPTRPDPNHQRVTEIYNIANHPNSTLNNLFGGQPSQLQGAVGTLDRNRLGELRTEIDTHYAGVIKGRERISARHLLVNLKDRRLLANGVLDEGRRLKMAIFSTNLMIADVKSIDLYRSGNREIAETMINGWAGWRRRAGQSIASKFFDSNTFTARDIIDHVAGVDKEGTYGFLRGLNPESSLADLRGYIGDAHVSVDALAGARAHLQEILEARVVAGHNDRIEIADSSWTIESLIHNLLLIETELESREFFNKVSNPATPEDKKLSKTEYLKKLWAQTHESDQKRQEGILEKLKNFPNTLKKYLMKHVWGKPFDEGIKEAKEKGLSGAERDAHLRSKGIPEIVIHHLMKWMAYKEMYNIGKGAFKWVGKKISGGAGRVAGYGKEKTGKLLTTAWDKVGRPVVGASGRGLKRAGKFALWDVPKFTFWTTPKFFMWDAPKAALKTTAKVAAWPFKLVGKVFSAIHYTPEKAAKLKAEMAAKQAKKAQAGSHGGGGHGGDGSGGGH